MSLLSSLPLGHATPVAPDVPPACPCRQREGGSGPEPLPKPEAPAGDGHGCRRVPGKPVSRGKLRISDDAREGRLHRGDLHAFTSGSGEDQTVKPVVGEGREHSGHARALLTKPCLLRLEVETLDHDGDPFGLGQRHDVGHDVPERGRHLIPPSPPEVEGDLTGLHRVSEAVDAAKSDDMRIQIHPQGSGSTGGSRRGRRSPAGPVRRIGAPLTSLRPGEMSGGGHRPLPEQEDRGESRRHRCGPSRSSPKAPFPAERRGHRTVLSAAGGGGASPVRAAPAESA